MSVEPKRCALITTELWDTAKILYTALLLPQAAINQLILISHTGVL
ncbi:hypothetical protein NIES22_23780 [Calothrix brevissima NIES-22]|nr:hypothetical protein NIES22_23780 [Calothrix brevissima NIES-22]